jgi:DNA-binding PadR family transcriptional regulator
MRLSPQTLIVLQALKHSARDWCHGYDVSKLTRIKSGTLYPILSRLHDEGWLEARWEEGREPGRPPRHLYRLSAAGSKATSKILDASAARTGSLRVARQS